MFSTKDNPFDPAKFAEMFTKQDFTKFFDASAMKGLDQSALMDAQKKNMDAMVAAQQAAAAGYQDLFQKQITIFQETLASAQAQINELSNTSAGPDAANKQAEMTQKAYELAVANVTELAEMAQKANTDAFEIVKQRVEDSVNELRKLV